MSPSHNIAEFHDHGEFSEPTDEDILAAAWKIQTEKGWFSIKDLYYACYGATRGNIWKKRSHHTSTRLLRVIQKAGAVKLNGKSGYTKYLLPKESAENGER